MLNRDDAIVRLMRLPGRTVQTFGASVPLSEEEWGFVRRPEGDWLARGGELLLPVSALSLVGRHNALNALAALALVSSVAKLGPPVREALAQFRGLPHRMQRIAEAGGVLYVNDSKGTTVAATEAALAGIGRPVVLIAGGDGKGQSFVPLKPAVDRACKAVLLIGRDAPLVARRTVGHDGDASSRWARSTRPSTRAFELAAPGDVVLLSPACASLDQFASYGERGERFAALVRDRLKESTLMRKRLSETAVLPAARLSRRRACAPSADDARVGRVARVGRAAAARAGPGHGLLVVDRDGRGVPAHRLPRLVLPRASRRVRRGRPRSPHRSLSRYR